MDGLDYRDTVTDFDLPEGTFFYCAVVHLRFRHPAEVITLAVRWYLRFNPSFRDLEEPLAERGIVVDHTSIYRWVAQFTPVFIDAAGPCRHVPGDRWQVDENYVKVDGQWRYLYRP